jgi:phosphonoacetaldehyde hydrolase
MAASAYRGPLRAVIFDWAGTTIDYGSRAPAGVFVSVFERRGVPITMSQARGPMGMHKRDHIAALLAVPEIAEKWHDVHGHAPTDADIQSLYEELVPLQIACLRDYAQLIPGTLEAVAACRARGMKVGANTGYNREMANIVLEEAKRQGYEPGAAVNVDDVPAGRPHPYMCYLLAVRLQVYPMSSMIKVGDTVPDIEEGLNAAMWTVAVAKTGNEIGLTEEEIAELPPEGLSVRLDGARRRLAAAGAHYVIHGIGDLPPILDEIEARLARGECP